MAHKDPDARREYQREYKRRMRSCPVRAEKERERERDLYSRTKESTREARLAKNARYREKNREALAEKERKRRAIAQTEYPEAFKEKMRIRSAEWRLKNKDCPPYKRAVLERSTAYYNRKKSCPEFMRENSRRASEWASKNRERFNAGARERRRDRYKNDVQFRLEVSLRRRLYMAIRGSHSAGMAIAELGCSILDFKVYMEGLFSEGMTWGNWGRDGWHIDHIIPISSFDLTDKDQVAEACHYTNLQPLWAKDNLSKGAKLCPGL